MAVCPAQAPQPPATSGRPASQVDQVDTSSRPREFATLSVGGSDLGFFDVMNACIFRFDALYSGTCAAAGAAIRGDDFELRLGLALWAGLRGGGGRGSASR